MSSEKTADVVATRWGLYESLKERDVILGQSCLVCRDCLSVGDRYSKLENVPTNNQETQNMIDGVAYKTGTRYAHEKCIWPDAAKSAEKSDKNRFDPCEKDDPAVGKICSLCNLAIQVGQRPTLLSGVPNPGNPKICTAVVVCQRHLVHQSCAYPVT